MSGKYVVGEDNGKLWLVLDNNDDGTFTITIDLKGIDQSSFEFTVREAREFVDVMNSMVTGVEKITEQVDSQDAEEKKALVWRRTLLPLVGSEKS